MNFEIPPEQAEKLSPLTENDESIKEPPISIEAIRAMCEGDPDLTELGETMLSSCVEYAITVAEFKRIFVDSKGSISEEALAINSLRKSVHDRTIDDINIFSRALARAKKDNSWMKAGGLDGKNRAAYGRFALTMTLSRLK